MGSTIQEPRSGISVFLSYPKPFRQEQVTFVSRVRQHLQARGLAPRTLGVTDYDMEAPLTAIRRLMMESNGLLTIAFRRRHISEGINYSCADQNIEKRPEFRISRSALNDVWFTTPWAHIEPAMAYQIGLPVLILREAGVVADGILEKGVLGTYLPEVDVDEDLDAYFASEAWAHVIARWEGYVRAVVDTKGRPPKLY